MEYTSSSDASTTLPSPHTPQGGLTESPTLFVSRLPKGSTSASKVETFLRDAFPAAMSVNVLRGASHSTHKGQAFVHFESAAAAGEALSRVEASGGLEWPLEADGAHSAIPLRVRRLSSLPLIGPQYINAAAEWDEAPLPPHCAQHNYTHCSFIWNIIQQDHKGAPSGPDADGGEGCIVRVCDDAGIHTVRCLEDIPFPVAMDHQSDAVQKEEKNISNVHVLVFSTSEERDTAVAAHPRCMARCGPPSLLCMMTQCRGLSDLAYLQDCRSRKRQRTWEEAARDCAELTPLSPSETLSVIQDFIDGREGGQQVAVRDMYGNVALLKAPVYMSCL